MQTPLTSNHWPYRRKESDTHNRHERQVVTIAHTGSKYARAGENSYSSTSTYA